MIRRLKNGVCRVKGKNIAGDTVSVSATLLPRYYKENTVSSTDKKEAETRGMLNVFDTIYEEWRILKIEEIQINGAWVKWQENLPSEKRLSIDEVISLLGEMDYTVERVKEGNIRYRVTGGTFKKDFEKGSEVIKWYQSISG